MGTFLSTFSIRYPKNCGVNCRVSLQRCIWKAVVIVFMHEYLIMFLSACAAGHTCIVVMQGLYNVIYEHKRERTKRLTVSFPWEDGSGWMYGWLPSVAQAKAIWKQDGWLEGKIKRTFEHKNHFILNNSKALLLMSSHFFRLKAKITREKQQQTWVKTCRL